MNGGRKIKKKKAVRHLTHMNDSFLLLQTRGESVA